MSDRGILTLKEMKNMLNNWPVAAFIVVALSGFTAGCSDNKDVAFDEEAPSATTSSVLTSVGRWISTDTSDVIQDPQTSGLIEINGQLVTLQMVVPRSSSKENCTLLIKTRRH